MNSSIRFEKRPGIDSLGIDFFWRLDLDGPAPIELVDYFIPELFYDFLFVRTGEMACAGRAVPRQCLMTLHTRGRMLISRGPAGRIELMGARLAMSFADTAWLPLPGNTFLPVDWADPAVAGLESFSDQVARIFRDRAANRMPPGLLSGGLAPTRSLLAYSSRHQRRLVKDRYGISLKEMEAVRGLHAFLGRTCDFSADYPRIIAYIDTEAFYDQPHLNRKFKQMTGLSPLEYFEHAGIIQENLMAVSYNAN